MAFAYFVGIRISTSPFGRVLHAIREDEVFAEALGKNTLYFTVTLFAVSAALAASAGSLFAYYITYIDPMSFTVMESILVISMVIIGGASSPWGPLIGAVVLATLPEVFRFLGLPSPIAANLRQVIYNYNVITIGVGMEAKIIAIGNSKGLRLPKEVLKRCNLADGQAVSIDVQGSDILIRPKTSPRGGWDAAFAKAGARRVRENLWGDLPVGESWDR